MANAIDLCLAATVAGDLGVAADATVDRVVTAASSIIAGYCGRTFEKGTALVEYPAGYGRPLLILDRPPIIGITSIYEGGELVAAADYETVGKLAEAGMVYRKNGTWMLTARDDGRITEHLEFQGSSDGIVATYDGGYVTPGQKAANGALTVTLPESVQEAAILTAVALYRRRGVDPNIASEAIGDWSVSYRGPNTLIGVGDGAVPDVARSLLVPYVIRRVS